MFGEKVVSKVNFSPLAICNKPFDVKIQLMLTLYVHWINIDVCTLLKCKNVLFILLTWSSMVISVPKVLSVFHFSVKVRPYSALLYLVSRLPATLLVSVLELPAVLNSYKGQF